MSYDLNTMRLMGGVPGQQLFLYRTADAGATVAAAGYFTPAVEEYNLSSGDVILAVSGFGGSQAVDVLAATVAGGAASTTALG
jgi:hypothetical protein